jgi:imidazole glycerol-phosphate synthase subunit HisH
MASVSLVNYGLGNIHAFANIYRRLNIDVDIVDDANGLASAERLILPGVGAFDWAMNRLNRASRCWACAWACK